ncbi:MAG: hypothetical protein HY513_04245 [Candidatus Aenigmarchaeota archaeon]|nr:hypothetical protein [Candidatus Aenigmarchaeota archaeon]
MSMDEPYGTLKRFKINPADDDRVFSAYVVGHTEDGFDEPNWFEVKFYYPDGIPLLSWPLNRTVSKRHDGYPTIGRAERALVEFSRWLLGAEPVAA